MRRWMVKSLQLWREDLQYTVAIALHAGSSASSGCELWSTVDAAHLPQWLLSSARSFDFKGTCCCRMNVSYHNYAWYPCQSIIKSNDVLVAMNISTTLVYYECTVTTFRYSHWFVVRLKHCALAGLKMRTLLTDVTPCVLWVCPLDTGTRWLRCCATSWSIGLYCSEGEK